MDPRPEPRKDIDRAVVVCSVWLHTGYIGVVAVVAGLIELFDPGASTLAALALAFCGGVLAAASWQRGRAVLEDAERSPAAARGAPSAVIRQLPRRGPRPRDRAKGAIKREARS